MRNLFLLCLVATLPAAAQTVDPTFTSPTSLYQPGAVYNIGPAQADGKRLISGGFSRVNNTTTGQLVRLDATGALDQAFLQNVGQATNTYVLKAGLNGQYLLGSQGGPITAGGLGRTELLRLNADGTGDASFDAGTGPAAASTTNAAYGNDYAVQPDGKVLAGGRFDLYGGTPAAGLVRLNANGTVDTGFTVGTGANTPTSQGEVQALLVLANGQIMAGGYFETFNNQVVNSLVRLSATGSVDATMPVVLQQGAVVNSLTLQPDGKILVTGYFNFSTRSTRLIRLLASGALDPTFTADALADNIAYSVGRAPLVLQLDGKILVVGYFSVAGAKSLARLNADGSRDTSFNVTSPPSTDLYSVGLQPSGRILVSSSNILNAFNNTQESTLGQYTSTGSFDTAYQPKVQATSSVQAVARQNDGTLLVGGYFTEWSGQPVHRVVHLSATGGLDATFSSQTGVLPGGVNSLVVQPDSRVLLGTSVGVQRLAASGAPDASFSSGLGAAYITKLALQPDSKVLAGGSFTVYQANGTTGPPLVRLTSTGALDPTFAAAPTATAGTLAYVSALLLQPDGRVVAAGLHVNFTTSGNTNFYVARYESTGAQDASFAPQVATGGTAYYSTIYALDRQADGKLLVGGDFTQLGATTRPGFARLTTTGSVDATFVPSSQFSGIVDAVAVQPNGRVLLGGQFTPAGSSAGANFTRVLTTGQPDASFTPTATPQGPVYVLLVHPDGAIVLAGNFTTINNLPQLAIARVTAPNVLAVAAPAATAARLGAWPVPAHELLHVAPDPTAQPQLAELLDAMGRPVRRQPLAGATEVALPTAGLPAGLYVLRITYATGIAARPIAVE